MRSTAFDARILHSYALDDLRDAHDALMRMPVSIDCIVSLSPIETLGALRAAGVWQESKMPAAMRKRGLLAVEIEVKGSRFQLRYYGMLDGDAPARLWGRVESHPQGARVVAQCGRSSVGVQGGLALAAGAIVFGIVAGDIAWALVVCGLILSALTVLATHSTRRDAADECQFLIERFDVALAMSTTLTPKGSNHT